MTIYNIFITGAERPDRMFAETTDVRDGSLVLLGEDDSVLATYSPGAWWTCLREDATRWVPYEEEVSGFQIDNERLK